jgi:hypothetical protein
MAGSLRDSGIRQLGMALADSQLTSLSLRDNQLGTPAMLSLGKAYQAVTCVQWPFLESQRPNQCGWGGGGLRQAGRWLLAGSCGRAPELLSVSRAFPSWKRSILTEIFLCHACSYHETEDGNARAGGTSAGSARGGVISLRSLDLGGVLSRPLGDDLSLQPTQQSALHPNAAIAAAPPADGPPGQVGSLLAQRTAAGAEVRGVRPAQAGPRRAARAADRVRSLEGVNGAPCLQLPSACQSVGIPTAPHCSHPTACHGRPARWCAACAAQRQAASVEQAKQRLGAARAAALEALRVVHQRTVVPTLEPVQLRQAVSAAVPAFPLA